MYKRCHISFPDNKNPESGYEEMLQSFDNIIIAANIIARSFERYHKELMEEQQKAISEGIAEAMRQNVAAIALAQVRPDVLEDLCASVEGALERGGLLDIQPRKRRGRPRKQSESKGEIQCTN